MNSWHEFFINKIEELNSSESLTAKKKYKCKEFVWSNEFFIQSSEIKNKFSLHLRTTQFFAEKFKNIFFKRKIPMLINMMQKKTTAINDESELQSR